MPDLLLFSGGTTADGARGINSDRLAVTAFSSRRAVQLKCTMRVLIATVALFAYAAAAPSGALLAAPYAAHGLAAPYAAHGLAAPYAAHGLAAPYAAHGLVAHAAPLAVAHAAPVAVAPAAHLAPALPTISPGDIHGAAIDAHVDASDHARAAVDQARELHDQAQEINGQAINAAEDHSWQAVDAVKTAEAQLDGAAAGAAPVLAKSLVGHVAPAVVAAPAVAAYAAPAAHVAYAAPAAHVAYAAPAVAAYAAAPAVAHSKSVVTQSLSQTHPAPVVHAPVVYSAPLVKAHGAIAHGW